MAEKTQKRPRVVEVSDSTAPPGYHYEGERARMFSGKVTQRLRRNITPPQSRDVMYADLYCSVITQVQEKDKVEYHCCIQGCSSVIQMAVKQSGLVIFSNFFIHLKNLHPEYLVEADRSLIQAAAADSTQSTMSKFLKVSSRNSEKADAEVSNEINCSSTTNMVISSAVSGTPNARSDARSNARADERVKENILAAFVEVIAHGPYPISFLQNPAVKQLLIKLHVIPENFKLPSRRTVTRRLDDFLNEENLKQNEEIIKLLDVIGLSWDEWTSKQNLNYMSLNLTGIPPDFSCLVDYILAVNKFDYPHEMPDIRKKVLALATRILPEVHLLEGMQIEEDGDLLYWFLKMMASLTYDGASANFAFSPNPKASHINADERQERSRVCAKYKTLEEARCLCHRIIKFLEHCLNDKGNEASDLYEKVFTDIYAFFNLISSSQKNIQELKKVQSLDRDRTGNIIGDIRAPETRYFT